MRLQVLFKNILPALLLNLLTKNLISLLTVCFVAATAVLNFRNMLDNLLPGCYQHTVSEFSLGVFQPGPFCNQFSFFFFFLLSSKYLLIIVPAVLQNV